MNPCSSALISLFSLWSSGSAVYASLFSFLSVSRETFLFTLTWVRLGVRLDCKSWWEWSNLFFSSGETLLRCSSQQFDDVSCKLHSIKSYTKSSFPAVDDKCSRVCKSRTRNLIACLHHSLPPPTHAVSSDVFFQEREMCSSAVSSFLPFSCCARMSSRYPRLLISFSSSFRLCQCIFSSSYVSIGCCNFIQRYPSCHPVSLCCI